MEVNLNRPLFTPAICGQLLEIPFRTLLFYEKEKLIIPSRTQKGRRLFSQADLSLLQFIKYLAKKRRVNTAGIKIILGLLEKAQLKNFDLKKEFFPDYEEKKLI
jgi:DNA-binding transcriptional MerR regulator